MPCIYTDCGIYWCYNVWHYSSTRLRRAFNCCVQSGWLGDVKTISGNSSPEETSPLILMIAHRFGRRRLCRRILPVFFQHTDSLTAQEIKVLGIHRSIATEIICRGARDFCVGAKGERTTLLCVGLKF
jgi:hypothetical protein